MQKGGLMARVLKISGFPFFNFDFLLSPRPQFIYFCPMMLRCLKSVVLLLAFAAVYAQPANNKPVEKWDLLRCVQYAMENNISIRQQDIQAKVDQLTYKQSVSTQYPNLNLGANIGINTGRSIDRTTNLYTTQSIFYNGFNLQSNVDIFNWFSKRNTISGNKYAADASVAAVDKLKDDVSLNIAAAYLQILLGRELVDITKAQISVDSAQLEHTKKLVDAGSVPELNLVQIQTQMANDSFNLVSAQGNVMQSLLLLKSLLNLDAGMPFDINVPPVEMIPIDPIAELQPEFVYALALKNMPQQKVSKLRLEAAQKFADAAKGAMYPSIGGGISIGTNYSSIKANPRLLSSTPAGFDTVGYIPGPNTPVVKPAFNNQYDFYASPYGSQIGDNFSNGIGISVSVPIFNGRSARTNWEKQKLNVKSMSLQKELDSMTLKQDIYKAYTDAMTALQKFNSSNRAVERAEKAFSYSQKRYEVGLMNTIDLLFSQNDLFSATLNRLNAQYDYVFKMKVLEFYKGEGIKL
jgi:outer membrane protein